MIYCDRIFSFSEVEDYECRSKPPLRKCRIASKLKNGSIKVKSAPDYIHDDHRLENPGKQKTLVKTKDTEI